jgi:glycosyltransferase involved in cell wall biosynthesis
MSSQPLLSVIVPAFNAAEFLGDALECIAAQSYPELEIIVVDDGSTDDTARVLANLQLEVRYFRQENRGPAGARNTGLSLARGELISFLDADDLWTGDALPALTAHLKMHPELDVVLGLIQYARYQRGLGCRPLDFVGDPCFSLSLDAGIFRCAVFDKVGNLDESLRSSEDVDWFMRAREKGVALGVLNRTVLYYRRHGGNLTHDRMRSHRELAYALKMSLDRRRRSGVAGSLSSVLSPGTAALRHGRME